MMTLQERINALGNLGKYLKINPAVLDIAMHKAHQENAWFTVENQKKAIQEISKAFFNKSKLKKWLLPYNLPKNSTPKTVGLILAGNIPLVGIHDIICVFICGHKSLIKLSEKDAVLLPALLYILNTIDTRTGNYFSILNGYMRDVDAIIATGSNNSARYFETYFSKIPHIIRKNRNAIAILSGDETKKDFKNLGHDLFEYFGLGCRNVSKIYAPRDYNFEPLLYVLHDWKLKLMLHDKYLNNFDYNFALLIMNKVKYQSSGTILLRELDEIASPIAVAYYSYYDDYEILKTKLREKKDQIQLVVTNKTDIDFLPAFPFGKAQSPQLNDYADGVDTIDFLCKI